MFPRTLIAMLCFGWLVVRLQAAPLPEWAATSRQIDPETIAAYEKLGAEYGGFDAPVFSPGLDDIGIVEFTRGKEAAAKLLPGFRFRSLPDGALPALPPVAVPFGIDLSSSKITDVDLKELKDLQNLTTLNLYGTDVTDGCLGELKGLKNLTTLQLYGTAVTDTGLKELKDFKNITILSLPKSTTRAGLNELKDIKSLTALSYNFARMEDEDLKQLKELKKLTTLDLHGTCVTNAGLRELKDLKNLTTLCLWYTEVTDAGLRELKGLKKMTKLYLGIDAACQYAANLEHFLRGCGCRW